ncbi:MAG: ion transporter [Bdellovibrionales bacterium]|nr:ion transporter [Bdellovibrionales bacterium]
MEGRPSHGLRRQLYIIIFEAETRLGKLFDVALLWAIVISIFSVILESDKAIDRVIEPYATYVEWVVTAFFTVEYILRLYVSKRLLRYAFSFFGVIDFLSIIPTYISLIFPGSQYFMVIRVLRLLRVFRILKLARYIKASRTLGQALVASRYKISIFLGVILSLVLIMGTCMYIVEGEQSGFSSIPRSMYWAIVTMTTVGYGDIVPQTTLGKMIASFMMLIGYAIIAVPTGIVTTELAEAKNNVSPVNCNNCGAPLGDHDKYCSQCGAKV